MYDNEDAIDEYALRQLTGRAVCVLTHDGIRHTGILTSCGSATVVLNGERTSRPSKRTRKPKHQAEINAAEKAEPDSEPAFWGSLGLEPPLEVSSAKAVISYGQVKAVWPI